MAYELTGFQNGTNLLTQFEAVNTITDQWLVILILLAVFVVSFIAFKSYETITALRTSSFIVGVISALFWTLGLLSTGKAMIPAIMVAFLILLSFLTDN